MADIACLSCVLCIWGVVQEKLLSCLGTAVADCLTFLRDQVVAEVRNLPFFWGNQVELINTYTAHLVGLEEICGYLEKIVGYLKDDAVGIVGIIGMGGVGKTTLLQMINNDFHKIGASGFDVVIWVTVSKDASIPRIQKLIGDRLGLRLSADASGSSSQAEEQAKAIFKDLSKRRFLLLLDDVWEKLDLVHVGIPRPTPENKCKIILTTRSKQVCRTMGTKRLVNVNILNPSESWKLFEENVATEEVDLDDQCINQLAKAVARKCGGLPLALITVGRAMADANSVGEWREALQRLSESHHKLLGMKDEVLVPLKFSFDRLKDESTKQCLLYCCLYPEDYQIPVEEVIDYWVGEGFLDDTQSDSIVRARQRGHEEITKLKSACLLESVQGKYSNVSHAKMHDVVREMCLWLTGGEFDKSNTFLVRTGRVWDRAPRSERWAEAKRISLMNNLSQVLRCNMPLCSNLQTLLLCNPDGIKYDSFPQYAIQQGFFQCMTVLCVLDLSWSGLWSIPDEISFLAELRYLNLRGTDIESLPKGLGKLAKLSQLDLDNTEELSHIPREAILTLTRLQVLRIYKSGYSFILPNESSDTLDDNIHIEGEGVPPSASMVDMGDTRSSCWDRLEELRLTVKILSSLEILLKFHKLCLCTTRLVISVGGDSGITAAHLCVALERLGKMLVLRVEGDGKESEALLDSGNRFGKNLEMLDLYFVPKITVVVSSPNAFGSLRLLVISDCHGIRDLMWVRQLPRLQEILIINCNGMEELVPVGGGVNNGLEEERGVDIDCDRSSLPALISIYLYKLPALKSISKRPFLFPSLEYLSVYKCPQLKKLPFGPDSAKNMREIRGKREWWESLEWYQEIDGQNIKSRFFPYYKD